MARGRDTEIGARSGPRGRKARGSAPTALTAPHPARSEPLRQAGQRVFNSVGPGARQSRRTGSRILRGGHHGGLNTRRRPAFPKTALADAYRSEGSSLASGGKRRWRRFCRSRERCFHSSYWFIKTLDHPFRQCKNFWALWIVGTAIIVKADANRRRMAKPFQAGDLRWTAPHSVVYLKWEVVNVLFWDLNSLAFRRQLPVREGKRCIGNKLE
jgi:hypothetical protein